MRGRGLAATFAVPLASGCLLLSRGAPLGPHYYDPEPPRRVAPTSGSPTCALELGDVDANDDLGQSIAFRRSRYEVGYYDTRRWTESPDNYLRRALVRALFDEGPVPSRPIGRRADPRRSTGCLRGAAGHAPSSSGAGARQPPRR